MKERSNIVSKKYVYLFSEGNGSMRELLGGKGANLAEMTSLGMPVPHGFTVTTEACTRYYEDGKTIAPEIEAEIFEFVSKLEALSGKKLGDRENPLLVSIRSGARASTRWLRASPHSLRTPGLPTIHTADLSRCLLML